MKVFISHQQADSLLASSVAARLRTYHQIDSYLDVIDPMLGRKGEELAAHVHAELNKCTQLLAVISEATRMSWWVPWEIGIATEKEYPLATYSSGPTLPPEFLRKWPYLRNERDLDSYASASKSASRTYTVAKAAVISEGVAKRRSSDEFYRNLRVALGQ